MLRYLFGAYEPLDEALSVLRSPGLIVIRRLPGAPGKVWRHDYYLTAKGRQVAADVLATAPDFEYYVQRTALVVELAAGRSGSELKNVQYGQQEYDSTKYLDHIGGIADPSRVLAPARR